MGDSKKWAAEEDERELWQASERELAVYAQTIGLTRRYVAIKIREAQKALDGFIKTDPSLTKTQHSWIDAAKDRLRMIEHESLKKLLSEGHQE